MTGSNETNYNLMFCRWLFYLSFPFHELVFWTCEQSNLLHCDWYTTGSLKLCGKVTVACFGLAQAEWEHCSNLFLVCWENVQNPNLESALTMLSSQVWLSAQWLTMLWKSRKPSFESLWGFLPLPPPHTHTKMTLWF